ncbi:hypothetical protein GOP47_0008202 [Adiantum capillus-veneris]|uniref:Uncharacterized protein n=1 Tax=Adiantum capillus-veneris TaxID=13818 RepID=A0A9D4UZ94_ADICA|nr:hypothetical protein GOP47_0008202 [Adiantum capillus-veneris]
MLCGCGGTCLELVCGTNPALVACIASKRACAAIDIDEPLILGYVLPSLRPKKWSWEEVSSSLDIDDEGDMPLLVNPYED